MRKSKRMEQLEQQHGRPIDELVAEALDQHETAEQAADTLGISRQTLDMWRWKLGITTRHVALVGAT